MKARTNPLRASHDILLLTAAAAAVPHPRSVSAPRAESCLPLPPCPLPLWHSQGRSWIWCVCEACERVRGACERARAGRGVFAERAPMCAEPGSDPPRARSLAPSREQRAARKSIPLPGYARSLCNIIFGGGGGKACLVVFYGNVEALRVWCFPADGEHLSGGGWLLAGAGRVCRVMCNSVFPA